MPLTIATWNVNSIKSRLHQLLPWLKETAPDVVLLQEIKTVSDTFPYMEIEELGYNVAVNGQKSYNGVAILSKYKLEDVRVFLPCDAEDKDDPEARYIEAVVALPGSAVRVASVYVPNGQALDSPKFPYKLRFLTRLKNHVETLLLLEEPFVLGGDFNVAPEPIDVFAPARLEGSICYHPLERARLRAILHLGMYDAFRSLHPHDPTFTWWDYRGRFDASEGLRIDYLLLSPHAADRLGGCEIVYRMRTQDRPSDHAPVMCSLTV